MSHLVPLASTSAHHAALEISDSLIRFFQQMFI